MTDKTPMCSVRVERTGWQGLRAHRDHESRKRGCSHVDDALTPLNRVLVGSGDAVADAEAHISAAGAKVRKNVAEPFITGIVTTSPEWFDGDTSDDRTRAWTGATVDFLRQRFGGDLVAASLHRDERTPHVHFVVVPIHRWRTKSGRERKEVSPRQALRGRDALSRLQDELAAHMHPLGIERGRRGSSARHERPKRFLDRATVEAEASLAVAQQALGDAERVSREVSTRERALVARERRHDDEVRKAVETATEQERRRLAEVDKEAKAFATGVAAFVAGDIVDASRDHDGQHRLHLRAGLPQAVRSVLLQDIRPAWMAVWGWVRRQAEALRSRRKAAVEEGRAEGRRQATAELAEERAAARRVLDLAGSALDRLQRQPRQSHSERAAVAAASKEYGMAIETARGVDLERSR